MGMEYGFAGKKDMGEDNTLYYNHLAIFFTHCYRYVPFFIKCPH